MTLQTIQTFIETNWRWAIPVGVTIYLFIVIELTLGFNMLCKKIFGGKRYHSRQEIRNPGIVDSISLMEAKPKVSKTPVENQKWKKDKEGYIQLG